ncbi:hypothetical protein D2E33_06640 [Mycobacteroides abscessus]|nr:hypothetical protein D2E33_06640 [Mycobacteroides abscessus]RIT70963.1 hypothetical protein D2E87_11410 [Mycobacteroides abscessus]
MRASVEDAELYVADLSYQLGHTFRWLLGCGNECVGGLAGSGCGSRSGVRTVSRTACLARVSDRDADISNVR